MPLILFLLGVILLPTNINLLVRTPEIFDNKVIDWNYVFNVNSSVHTHMDNTSDYGNKTDDDDDDYDFLHTDEDMDILESLF